MRKLLWFVVLLDGCFSWSSFNERLLHLKANGTNNWVELYASLQNFHVGATPVSEERYPWAARVVHSRTDDTPHMCTAVCVAERIFITAARCIFSLKVTFTTVVYRRTRCPALAFVLPSTHTKQLFDNIGFIVVRPVYQGSWATLRLFDATNRTDDRFEWFANLDLMLRQNDLTEFKVVGYSINKPKQRLGMDSWIYNLTELTVSVDINMCNEVYTLKQKIDFENGYFVPCYHSCSLEQFNQEHSSCKNYHGVEGGAVIDSRTNKLLGVATWGAYFPKYNLPVGFSVPNSKDFFTDYECALRIRNQKGADTSFNYQSLCE